MTRILTPLVSAIALFAAAPAFAQDHSMHGMPGMAPPGEVPPAQEKKKDKAAARPRAQTPAPDATQDNNNILPLVENQKLNHFMGQPTQLHL